MRLDDRVDLVLLDRGPTGVSGTDASEIGSTLSRTVERPVERATDVPLPRDYSAAVAKRATFESTTSETARGGRRIPPLPDDIDALQTQRASTTGGVADDEVVTTRARRLGDR